VSSSPRARAVGITVNLRQVRQGNRRPGPQSRDQQIGRWRAHHGTWKRFSESGHGDTIVGIGPCMAGAPGSVDVRINAANPGRWAAMATLAQFKPLPQQHQGASGKEVAGMGMARGLRRLPILLPDGPARSARRPYSCNGPPCCLPQARFWPSRKRDVGQRPALVWDVGGLQRGVLIYLGDFLPRLRAVWGLGCCAL